MNNYPHLFSPLRVRGKLIKNRIFSAPMGVGTITPFYTREHLELYKKIARGGAGVVTLGEAGA